MQSFEKILEKISSGLLIKKNTIFSFKNIYLLDKSLNFYGAAIRYSRISGEHCVQRNNANQVIPGDYNCIFQYEKIKSGVK